MISFSKYQGAGNDFIVIDDMNQTFPMDHSKLISRLCHRQYGIGSDGLILLQTSKVADYKMRFLNPDGKEVGLCGNGLRCLAHFIQKTKGAGPLLRIETPQGVMKARLDKNSIAVSLGNPRILSWNFPLHVQEIKTNAFIVHTGVPHLVFFSNEIHQMDLDVVGKKIRMQKEFQAEGINVNVASIRSQGTIDVRTYERGVEAETLACGTGAAAVAYVAKTLHQWQGPVVIVPKSQESLTVYAEEEMIVQGNAHFVFQGQIEL